MADSTSSTGNQTVVVRHSALTYISLGFNALILLLILAAIVCGHHHKKDRDHGDRGKDRFEHREFAGRGYGGFHHHFMMMHGGWGRGGFGGQCPFCQQNGMEQQGFGGRQQGWGNKPGFGGFGNHQGFGGFSGNSGNNGFGGQQGMMPHGPMGMGMKMPSADEMTGKIMAMLTQKLTLTDQENAQIKPIVQGVIEQFQKDMEAQKAAGKKTIDDAKTKVRAVLTPDQQKQFDAMMAAMPQPPSK